jgi:pimeloyl-ACP methyl ester carboxylesterase
MARVAILGFLVHFLLLGACASTHGRVESDVVFTRYSALSRNLEIARRALPPLTFRHIQQALAAGTEKLTEQAIDLANERFDIYIPAGAPPPEGYGLLVFIAPWNDPARPRTWHETLDRHRLIFVAAQKSGNNHHTLDRRLPLAILAYENVHARYPIDDKRVYVMGHSGGSRVAEIVALAYPDLFRGAIFNAGADPIDGSEGMYKPPVALLRAFQRSRLVYITGDLDTNALLQDEVSMRSMRDACVLDITTEVGFGLRHEVLDERSMDRALDALEVRSTTSADELARCNARVERELRAALADAAAAIARGDRDGARARLKAIDARFGGLAARELIDLADRLDDRLAPQR